MELDLREHQSFYRSLPSSMLKEVDPNTQVGPSHKHPGPVNVATNKKQSGSHRLVAQDLLHKYLTQHISGPHPNGPRTNTISGRLQTRTELDPSSHTNGTPKGQFCQAPDPAGNNSAWGGGKPLHNASYMVMM